MHNKSVAKNKCQYIEVGLDDTKKSNELSFLPKKLISNKLNTQKFYEEYDVTGPLSKMSQEPVFITSSDKNKEIKRKPTKKIKRVRRNKKTGIENDHLFVLVMTKVGRVRNKKNDKIENNRLLNLVMTKVRRVRNKKTGIKNDHLLILVMTKVGRVRNKKTEIKNDHLLVLVMTKVERIRRNKNDEIENDHLLDLVMIKIMNLAISEEMPDNVQLNLDETFESQKNTVTKTIIPTLLKVLDLTKSGYERSLKTVIKKVVLKYNDGNENTNYSKNKNHRSTSFQKSVLADDEEFDESDESDE
ncbi:hypothetical protein C1645_827567 [Glomus cerebriforme]|uniref:Uncharacterized protein n=1 Tax=Glomus cerebriforme TaxID=658196 RepID=A0A397SRN9_9GLOM|nr:hypothetical protein C1645_827567 [Glomus cerebriforme]